MSLLPWQIDLWQRLTRLRSRLPHAILLKGSRGTGKFSLGRIWAKSLLCEQPQEKGLPCGNCPACNWFEQGGHPDFRLVEPVSAAEETGEKGEGQTKRSKQHIGVEQIRELADFLNIASHRGGYRVVVIHPAEAMNAAAANALLKTLEEPGPGTLFILVSHRPQRLPATIISRCHQISVSRPDPAVAEEWLREQGAPEPDLCLAESGGAPLAALDVADPEYRRLRKAFLEELSQPRALDPIGVAERMLKIEPARTVLWLQRWCYDLASLRLTGRLRYNPDFADRLTAIGNSFDILAMTRYLRSLAAAQRVVQHPLNSRLFVEDLLLSYGQLVVLN